MLSLGTIQFVQALLYAVHGSPHLASLSKEAPKLVYHSCGQVCIHNNIMPLVGHCEIGFNQLVLLGYLHYYGVL